MFSSAALPTRIQTWRALIAPRSPTRFSIGITLLLAVGFALLNAVAIVQALNLYHAIALSAPVEQEEAMRNGHLLFALEERLDVAIEPLVQHMVAQGIGTPLGELSGAFLRRCSVWIYLHAFPAWLFAALAWSYVYKQPCFAWLRDTTIISALLAVACYRLFPLAPPRFILTGAPYNMQDWTYGATSVDPHVVHIVGFNQYAAFPSVHLLCALIPALCLARGSRTLWVWAGALCYPLVMTVIIICTGNHYILDCAGSLAILALSGALAGGIDRVRRHVLARRRLARLELPAALCLCLCCAGILATVGVNGGVRVLVAAAILVLIVLAGRRSPYLWQGRRFLEHGRQPLWRTDYLAGFLFVAGASAAAHAPTRLPPLTVRLCALLWLCACLCALARHMVISQASQVSRAGAGADNKGLVKRYLRRLHERALGGERKAA